MSVSVAALGDCCCRDSAPALRAVHAALAACLDALLTVGRPTAPHGCARGDVRCDCTWESGTPAMLRPGSLARRSRPPSSLAASHRVSHRARRVSLSFRWCVSHLQSGALPSLHSVRCRAAAWGPSCTHCAASAVCSTCACRMLHVRLRWALGAAPLAGRPAGARVLAPLLCSPHVTRPPRRAS
eukprot:scaffold10623_cov139-Isochrysis_galbana.AAC.8